ncbi:hypothetical protein D9M71_237630 [compost metagenome]
MAHRRVVDALRSIQRPDHAVERTPTGQAVTAFTHRIVQLVLHTAAPEQHGVLVYQPMVLGQAGGDGLDLLGFADDEQEADLVAPETTMTFA